MNDRLEELRSASTPYLRMEDDDQDSPAARSQSSGNVRLLEPFFDDLDVVKVSNRRSGVGVVERPCQGHDRVAEWLRVACCFVRTRAAKHARDRGRDGEDLRLGDEDEDVSDV
jgi:hypothetical protein